MTRSDSQGGGGTDPARQTLGRPLDPAEEALADALMEIYATGTHDFARVAAALAEAGVRAPRSGRTDWTEALLAEELAAINADLDACAGPAHGA
ncbi:MAG: hypothetical protein KatS3mg118_1317 [Paracoccaceae bacterium]|nr:MAG: hypothetical protein KatS3mg118_1317 [Paracoccaceae bacterium]